MDDDTENAVVLIDEHGDRIIGFIVSRHYGYALIQYADHFGMEHQEYLSNEDYELLEEWTQE